MLHNMAQVKPFMNVSNKPLFDIQNKINGSNYFSNLRKVSVGSGSEVVRADRSGWWAGANRFADAPFRVDMQGNVYLTSASGQLILDTVNNRIVVYDGSNVPRILIGYQSGGF